MTKREIIAELKRLGWKCKRGVWSSPHHKRIHQHLSLREAASLEALTALESLSTVRK